MPLLHACSQRRFCLVRMDACMLAALTATIPTHFPEPSMRPVKPQRIARMDAGVSACDVFAMRASSGAVCIRP